MPRNILLFREIPVSINLKTYKQKQARKPFINIKHTYPTNSRACEYIIDQQAVLYGHHLI